MIEPTICYPVLNDGLLRGNEVCDDGNFDDGDGCSSSGGVEQGWYCDRSGEPSVCWANMGDGFVRGEEECDDGNVSNGDGCSEFGVIEDGFLCQGEPSQCN